MQITDYVVLKLTRCLLTRRRYLLLLFDVTIIYISSNIFGLSNKFTTDQHQDQIYYKQNLYIKYNIAPLHSTDKRPPAPATTRPHVGKKGIPRPGAPRLQP